jgi:RNA polymerase sigma-70 factor (ECF subfamily)
MDWYRQQQSNHITEVNEDNNLQNLKSASVMDICKETEMVNEQVLIDIKRMVDQLPAAQREVVYMRYYQQLSFKEIADLTGVSINTSLGRMRYALINLRRMAKDYQIELALCG